MTIPNPFFALGLEPRFALDPADIRRRTMRAAIRLHPDRAADPVSASEQAIELASINEAAGVLLDEIARAEAIIRFHDGPSPSEDHSLPEGFLEAMLSTRMELEEAVESGNEAGKSALEEWARSEWAERRNAVADLLDQDPVPGSDRLISARREINRWRYSQRMLEQLESSTSVPGS